MNPGNDATNPYALPEKYADPNARLGAHSESPPAVRFWVQVYNVCMVLLYVGVTAMGVLLVVFSRNIAELAEDGSGFDSTVIGMIYSVLGFVFACIFAVGLVWRHGNGAWIYQIILIAIGLTSCFTWPATIPLLIYWIKDRQRLVGGQ